MRLPLARVSFHRRANCCFLRTISRPGALVSRWSDGLHLFSQLSARLVTLSFRSPTAHYYRYSIYPLSLIVSAPEHETPSRQYPQSIPLLAIFHANVVFFAANFQNGYLEEGNAASRLRSISSQTQFHRRVCHPGRGKLQTHRSRAFPPRHTSRSQILQQMWRGKRKR